MTNHYERMLEIQALNKDLAIMTAGHNIFGTLTFSRGFTESDKFSASTKEKLADDIHRQFWQRIDRTYYSKKAVAEGVRIGRVCFKHFGSSGTNIHYHFTAKANCAEFAILAKQMWLRSGAFTGKIQIETIRDWEDAYHYLGHEYVEVGSKSFCERTTHWDVSAVDNNKHKNISQLRRLLKATDVDLSMGASV